MKYLAVATLTNMLSRIPTPMLATLNQFDFHHTLEERRGLSIVFFSSTSCASCSFWKQLLGNYKQRHPEIEVYEVDAKQDQALAEEFNLFHLPALFLYADGAFHAELQCEANFEKLDASINAALRNPAQEAP